MHEVFETVGLLQCLAIVDEGLHDSLREARKDIAYLADIFQKLNDLNLRLQGKNMDLIQTKKHIESFMAKLSLLRKNIQRYELHQLPRLNKENVSTENVEVFSDHIKMLNEYFELRFSDLLQMDIPRWIIDPFSFQVELA